MNTKKIGRPKRAMPIRFATMAWASRLTQELQMSAFQMEALIEPSLVKKNDAGISISSNKYKKYLNGTRTPDVNRENNPVLLSDAHVPLASQWFFHPAWRLLDPEPLNNDQRLDLLSELSETSRINKVLACTQPYSDPTSREARSLAEHLRGIEHLNEMAWFLCEARRKSSRLDSSQAGLLRDWFAEASVELGSMPQLTTFIAELLNYIDERFLSWSLPKTPESIEDFPNEYEWNLRADYDKSTPR